MELLNVELEGLPPTVNQMYRNASSSNVRYKTKKTREYQEYAVGVMKNFYHGTSYSGSVALYVVYLIKDKRRWDIDNRLKALQDCLQIAKVIDDDSQINFLQVRRKYGYSVNKTLLTLKEFTNE